MRFGHCSVNHSSNLAEIPSGPPQLLLFSLDMALVSSTMLIGESRSLLNLLLNLGILMRNSLGKNLLKLVIEKGSGLVLRSL